VKIKPDEKTNLPFVTNVKPSSAAAAKESLPAEESKEPKNK